MTYQQRIIKLSEQYDLDTLGDQQDIQLEQSFNQGRIKLKKAINRAEAKKGFSNTKVANKLKEQVLFELVEKVAAEFALIQLSEVGEQTAEFRRIFQQFISLYQSLEDYDSKGEGYDDITQLIHINTWTFIALNKMLDAAAMPASNDFQVKRSRFERRRFDEEDIVSKRPAIQTVMREIGDMILFQVKMEVFNRLSPYWFKREDTEAKKNGNAGLRYYQRDMEKALDDLQAWALLKNDGEDKRMQTLVSILGQLNKMLSIEKVSIIIGSWLYSIIFQELAIFKEVVTIKSPTVLDLDDEHQDLKQAWLATLNKAAINKPMVAPPLEMTAQRRGGRTHSASKPTVLTHKGEFAMSETRAGFFNTQALVPFAVNEWVLDITDILKAQDIALGSFDYFMAPELPMPSDLITDKPQDWDRWEDHEQYAWLKQHHEWRNVKRAVSQQKEAQIKRLKESQATKEIHSMASEFRGVEAIWFPTFPEFRGRLMVDVPYFNYQGRDSAKALIRLAEPVSIVGSEKRSRFWLANHLASTYGHGLDKLPLEKRENAVEAPLFQAKITAVALMLDDFSLGLDVLKEAEAGDGKPLMFAAACREWYELFIARTKTDTFILVGNDCSCSGQQFHSAWRQSRSIAVATNVIPSDTPQDLYLSVWHNLYERIADKLSRRHERALRLKGYGRAIVKGGIQPSQYGSGRATGKAGVAAKIDKLSKKGFKLSADEVLAILGSYQKALDEVCEMNTTNSWFRHFAALCDEAGLDAIKIPTACGDTIIMRYQQLEGHRIDTFKYGSITYKQPKKRSLTILEPNGKPTPDKWRTSLTANTTHGAGDATLLALALYDCPYNFATNHDAVYCAAPHMDDMRHRMRQAFCKVGSFDIFEALQQANGITMPADMSPVVGTWTSIGDVMESTYFTS